MGRKVNVRLSNEGRMTERISYMRRKRGISIVVRVGILEDIVSHQSYTVLSC